MKNKNYLLTSLIVAGLVTSCAKERELDTVYKAPEITSKSAINTEAEFLYVPTSQGVPRFTKAMKPFVQGNEKIVKFKFEEEGIVAYEMEKNETFQDSTLNNKPILTIPVTYKSFRCAENADKECTNREEENTELEWFQKDNFVPDFESVKVLEADSIGLPENEDPCYSLQATKLVNYEVTKTDLHFEIEKTYKFSNTPACTNELWYSSGSEYDKFLENLDDNGAFNTRVFFSFAKLDTIASPNYKDIAYPVEEHGTFGFFKTKERTKNAFGQTERTYKLNRWNPAKRVVDYYLSDEFSKKENKYLKDATIFAFDRMNTMLENNKVNLRLKLHMPEGKRPGNLRNTMVVLIEDIASSLLGYGPTVANPRTGEIVKGHVNMYKGSLESIAPSAYDSIVFLEKQLKKEASNTAAIQASLKASKKKSAKTNAKDLTAAVKKSLESKAISTTHLDHGHNHGHADLHTSELSAAAANFKDFKKKVDKRLRTDYQSLVLGKVDGQLNEFTREMKDSLEIKELLHKNSVYTTDMFNFQALGKISVDEINTVGGIRNELGELKDWIQLNESQQRTLIKILARHAYIPTLVHEIGHNLGLRHNFRGSLDAANYYNKEEREKLGLTSGSVFSSIMDYSYSSLNELSTFGKYDIAALKFGYNRAVEVREKTSGKIRTVSLEQPSLDGSSIIEKSVNEIENRVEYKFCTDEDVNMYADCNRFDEGSNDLEMTKHYAAKYKEYYQWRNMKNRSKNFNDRMGTWRYYLGTYYTLLDLRQAHETWQFYKTYLAKFNLERMINNKCNAQDRINDPKFCETIDKVVDANDVATRTLLDIVKTPDLTCDVQYSFIDRATGKPAHTARVAANFAAGTLYKSYPLENGKGEYRATSCFDQNAALDIFNEREAITTASQSCLAALGQEKCSSDDIGLSAQVVGQVGKLHNDIDAADRDGERLETDDIEVRGTWLDKVLAMEILTNRDRLTSAGESIHASFTDMPKYKAEITNLLEHLALNKTLESPIAAETRSGVKYQMPFATDLHAKTKVPTIKRFLKQFIPFPDSKEFDIAPVLLKTAAINSYESENDSESLSQYVARSEFFDSLVVRRKSSASTNIGFGASVKLIANVHDFTYGATERNTLAAESIARINGLTTLRSEQIESVMREMSKVETPAEEEVVVAAEEVATEGSTEEEVAAVESEAKAEIIEITAEVQAKVMQLISIKQTIAIYQSTFDKLLQAVVTNSDGTPEGQERLMKVLAELRVSEGARNFDAAEELFVNMNSLIQDDMRLLPLANADLYDLKFTMSNEEARKEILDKEVDSIWALPIID